MNDQSGVRRPRAGGVTAVITAVALLWPGASDVVAATCWSPPVAAPVVDPFREPACRWCPGNRGLEYGTRAGDPVRSVSSGEVTFAGRVAGTLYVVVRHSDGRRVTYGNLASRRVDSGDEVVRGSVVGHAAGRFHLGVRVGDRYVDPAQLIGVIVGVVRLVPADGSAAAPAPPPRLACVSRATAA